MHDAQVGNLGSAGTGENMIRCNKQLPEAFKGVILIRAFLASTAVQLPTCVAPGQVFPAAWPWCLHSSSHARLAQAEWNVDG
jgi:hypothetical protein